MKEESKKNKRIGLGISIVLHAGILFIFYFQFAWKIPDPPLPRYGIELDFGINDAGSGDKNPIEPIKNQESLPPVDENKDESKAQNEESETESSKHTTEEFEETPEALDPKEKQIPEQQTPNKEVEKVQEEPQKEIEKPTTEKSSSVTGNQGNDPNKTGDKGSPEGDIDDRGLYGKRKAIPVERLWILRDGNGIAYQSQMTKVRKVGELFLKLR